MLHMSAFFAPSIMINDHKCKKKCHQGMAYFGQGLMSLFFNVYLKAPEMQIWPYVKVKV